MKLPVRTPEEFTLQDLAVSNPEGTELSSNGQSKIEIAPEYPEPESTTAVPLPLLPLFGVRINVEVTVNEDPAVSPCEPVKVNV